MRNFYTCGCLQNDFYNKTFEEVIKIFNQPSDYLFVICSDKLRNRFLYLLSENY